MITIKEIAKRANTSRGTVDRVVNNRGKVNKELEARIRKIMEEEHYVPNEVARVLTMSGQKINIGVIIGSINHDFLEIVKKGVIKESEKHRFSSYNLLLREVELFDKKSTLDYLEEFKRIGIDGLIITVTESPEICQKIEELNVPVIALNIDMNVKNKIAFVGCDYFNSGALSANMANLILPYKSRVGVVIGSIKHKGQHERLSGFKRNLRSDIAIVDIKENYDDDTKSYILTKKMIDNNLLNMVYFCGGGVSGGIEAIKESKMNLKVITVDQVDEVKKGLQTGLVSATIVQHPYSQGVKAFFLIYNYLFRKKQVPAVNIIENDVYLKSSVFHY